MHVLIVEDIHFSSLMVEKYLKTKKYTYTVVTNGFDALEAMENGPAFDVVICDLYLPDMNGTQVFEQCRQLKRYKKQNSLPPFILLTSSNNPQDLQKAEGAGFTATFTKPFNATAMGEILASIDDGQGYIQRDAENTKIIVVDNTGKNHDLLQEVFANSGYKLMLASSPGNCLELLEQFSGVKAIITELEFSDQSANDMMAQIAKIPKLQAGGKPVSILLTESKNVDLVQLAYLSGFDDVIQHPIDKFNLKQKINKAFIGQGKKSAELSTILIVDDVFFYCTMAKNLLIKAGLNTDKYQFKTMQSGYDALEELKANMQVKLVLTDLLLKDISGYELLQLYQSTIQMHRSRQTIPQFALMTAIDDDAEVEGYIDKGFQAVFPKPLQTDLLKDFIEKELDHANTLD
jgi:CheY-like chemotaxis protein